MWLNNQMRPWTLFWILLLMGSLVFLVQLNELNQFDGHLLSIKIPFLKGMDL